MTNRLTIARYVSMSVCLCAFTFLPVPHLLGLSWVEAAEAESPCQKDREFSEKELAGDASARRQLTRIPQMTPQTLAHDLRQVLENKDN